MWILPLLGYAGLLLGFVFLTLSIASGLYYLSELVEEHTVLAARLLRRLVYAVVLVSLLLWLVDSFPWHLTLLSVASHAVYLGNLRRFPIVKLTDPVFVVSCVAVLVNHWAWFRYFSSPPETRGGGGRGGRPQGYTGGRGGAYYNYYDQPSFTEIASYFGICVWLVPFALFVSLSAGENVLPSMGSEYATGERNGITGVGPGIGGAIPGLAGSSVSGNTGFTKGHKRRNTGLAKAAVASTREWLGETGAVMGLWQRDNVRSFG